MAKFYGIESSGSLSTLTTHREAGYTFIANEDIMMIGFRLYTPVALTAITCRLWNSNKSVIASATVPQTEVNNWVEVYLDNPIDLVSGQTYTVSCWIANDRYSCPTSSVVTSSSITIKTGCHGSTQGKFPTNNGSNIYQLIDIVCKTPAENKYLIRCQDTIYTITDGVLTALEATELRAEVFQTYGLDEVPEWSVISELVNPEILYWQDVIDDIPRITATMTAKPPSQVLLAEPFYLVDFTVKGVESVTVESSGSPLIALSFDGGDFEHYDSTNGWVVSAESEGMLPDVLTAIDLDTWSAKVAGVQSIQIRVILSSTDDSLTNIKFDFINE